MLKAAVPNLGDRSADLARVEVTQDRLDIEDGVIGSGHTGINGSCCRHRLSSGRTRSHWLITSSAKFMNLELTDEQGEALADELDTIVRNDRYPLSPRIQRLKAI